jgi:hypothetical protein
MDPLDTLHRRMQELEAENHAMREILVRVAEGRVARDPVTMIESCLYCTLKRGGEYGYKGKHSDTCIVTLARQFGF